MFSILQITALNGSRMLDDIEREWGVRSHCLSVNTVLIATISTPAEITKHYLTRYPKARFMVSVVDARTLPRTAPTPLIVEWYTTVLSGELPPEPLVPVLKQPQEINPSSFHKDDRTG